MKPDQDQYDFIMDPSQQSSSSGPSFLKNPNQRTIIGVVFVVISIIFAVATYGFVTSLNKQDNSHLVDMAAYQTEIIRVVDLGLLESKDPDTLAQIRTLRAFMKSDLAGINSYVAAQGVKLEKLQLSSKKDAKIDTALVSASQRNAYDEELLRIIQILIGNYKVSLQAAINENLPSPERQEVLKASAQNITVYEVVPS